MMGFSRAQTVAFWLMVAAIMIAPAILYPVFLMKVLCFALFACAFNLLLGYGGLLSFGHAAFYGGASYITAQAVKFWGFEPLLGVLAGAATASILGIVFGFLAIRRQGIYFAMITLALAQMVYFFAVQVPFTNNDEGIQAVPRGRLLGFIDLGNSFAMYYFVFIMFLLGYWIVHRTVNSPFGGVLRAIRENEQRAISLGYETDHYKLVAFVLSAALTGVAGGLDALIFQLASLTNVHWTMSGHAILMTILGGGGGQGLFSGNKKGLKDTVSTFLSAYQLLPNYPVLHDPKGPVDLLNDDSWVLPEKAKLAIKDAREFHEELGTTSRVPVVSIFGYGQKTLHRIEVKRNSEGEFIDPKFFEEECGDGTVAQESAVFPGSEIHPVQQQHGALYTDNDVKMRLKLELLGTF